MEYPTFIKETHQYTGALAFFDSRPQLLEQCLDIWPAYIS